MGSLITLLQTVLPFLKPGKEILDAVRVNQTELAGQENAEFLAVLNQFGAEFAQPRVGWFDALVNGLNRLPRPAFAFGTIGLFVFAFWRPIEFTARMQALAVVPDSLWWLLGAVVSFYFGARELNHARGRAAAPDPAQVAAVAENIKAIRAMASPLLLEAPQGDGAPGIAEENSAEFQLENLGENSLDENPALLEWQKTQGAG